MDNVMQSYLRGFWAPVTRWLSRKRGTKHRRPTRRFHIEQLESRLALTATTVSTYRALDFNYTASFSGTNDVPFYHDAYSGTSGGSGRIEFISPTESRPGSGLATGIGRGSGTDTFGPYSYHFSGELKIENHNGVIDIREVPDQTSFYYDTHNSEYTGGGYIGAVPAAGTFKVSDYSIGATWNGYRVDYGYNVHYVGQMTGVITDKITAATDLAVRAVYTNGGNNVEFNVDVTGKHMKAATQATAVTRAGLYWSRSASRSDVISEVAMPAGTNMNIYWNSGNLKVSADTLGAVPSGATHLLFIADPDGKLTEANEANNIVALQLHDVYFPTIVATPTPNGFVFGTPFNVFASVANVGSTTTQLPRGSVTFGALAPSGSTYPNSAFGTAPLTVSPAAPNSTSAQLSATVETITGRHQLLVSYTSTSFHKSKAETSVTFDVVRAASTVSIVGSPSPGIYGQDVTYTVRAQPLPNRKGVPTGTVDIKDGATLLGRVSLVKGVATLSTKALIAGTHTITATYSGNSNFLAATSSSITTTVSRSMSSTTLTASRTAAVNGQSVAYTVVVVPRAPSVGTPTGIVAIMAGTVEVGSATLSGGRATINVTTLPIGTQNVTAVYRSDRNFSGSTSAARPIVVSKAGTVTTVVDSVDPAVFGQTVTFQARVAVQSPGTGVPTGTVTFKDGTTTLGTVSIVGGVATLTNNSLAASATNHSITAVYNGDTRFLASTSAAITTKINAATTTTTISGPASPVQLGQPVVYTIRVAANSPSARVPAGTVSLMLGTTVLGTATLSVTGTATISTNSLPLGVRSVNAVYAPSNANFLASTSAVANTTVEKIHSAIALTATPSTAAFGRPVTLRAAISGQASGQPLATGSVTFFNGATSLGTVALVNGVANLSTSTLPVGTRSLRAVYAGDARFSTVTSIDLPFVITSA